MEKGPTSARRYDVGTSEPHQVRRLPQTDGIPRRASHRAPETSDGGNYRLVLKQPASIAGCPAEKAFKGLPFLPDQERTVTLWLVLMAWIGSLPITTPSERVEFAVALLDDVQTSGWIPGFSIKLAKKSRRTVVFLLMTEYGVLQVSHALLGCLCFYVLLEHESVEYSRLLRIVDDASRQFEEWADSLFIQDTANR